MRYTLAALAIDAALTSRAHAADPIRIGERVDQSSVFSGADGDGSILGVRMAVEDFGPVLGRPVEVLTADHQDKPDVEPPQLPRRLFGLGQAARTCVPAWA